MLLSGANAMFKCIKYFIWYASTIPICILLYTLSWNWYWRSINISNSLSPTFRFSSTRNDHAQLWFQISIWQKFDAKNVQLYYVMHKSSRIFYVKSLLQNRFQPIMRYILELLPIGKFELTKAFRLSAFEPKPIEVIILTHPRPIFLCQMSGHLCWIIPCKWCPIKITFDKKSLFK